jgi:hypothetical protein
MIGSISVPVPVSSIQQVGTNIISGVYGYALGYQAADSLQPGKAYWVKVYGNGELILSGTITPITAAKTSSIRQNLEHNNSITVQDAAGNAQSLYFGQKSSPSVSSSRYDLPPLPPAGAFDVRFESQRLLEEYVSGSKTVQQYRVDLSSAVYPVKVSLNVATIGNEQIFLADIAGNKLSSAKGYVVIANPNITSFVLNVQSIPKEFALYQNYPNPFNPVSTIRYELPVDSRVVLKVYDLLGREVETLLDNNNQEAGMHQAVFDATSYASGVYFYRLEAASVSDPATTFSRLKKMLLVK